MLIGSQTHTHKPTHTHRNFYTQKLLHTGDLHRCFYTQTLYTQTLLHTQTLYTRRSFYTHTHARALLHTNIFTHNLFTHKRFYTQTLWYTDHFTHKHFKRFTHRPFRTQRLLHTNALTHRPFYTQTLLTQTRLHTNSFNYTQALVHANPLTGPTKLAKKKQFWTLEPRFVQEGCRRTNQTRKKPSVFDTQTSFRHHPAGTMYLYLIIGPNCWAAGNGFWDSLWLCRCRNRQAPASARASHGSLLQQN